MVILVSVICLPDNAIVTGPAHATDVGLCIFHCVVKCNLLDIVDFSVLDVVACVTEFVDMILR